MSKTCQVCRARPSMCEQVKNGKRTFKCVYCREGRGVLPEIYPAKRLLRRRQHDLSM